MNIIFAAANEISNLTIAMDTVWTMFAAFLVFFMNAGFAFIGTGFCRKKNAVNILAKNFVVFAIATIAYWALGFAFMFGDGTSLLGLKGFFPSESTGSVFSSLDWTKVPLFAKFFFQLVFAATAATIVSGAVAERIKFSSYIIFSFVLIAFMYPVTGKWIWGGGWLSSLGFYDFAGSTVVHSVGGWAALAGVLILGPRLGKYRKGGRFMPIVGHSIPMATLGGFILWLGWFGFNPGSTMAADGGAIARIAVTTNIAAAAGIAVTAIITWIKFKKPDHTMMINGALGGLVAITAPCNWVTPFGALAIGAVAGIIVYYGVIFFDRVMVDDPVGATSVHLLNGVWGTLSLGLFAFSGGAGGSGAPLKGLFYGGGASQLWKQFIGVVAVGAFTFIVSMIVWYVIKLIQRGIRVSAEEECGGLDVGEMGMEAYPEDPFGNDMSVEEQSVLKLKDWRR
jgi:Amt family ammonium transporter